MTTGTYKINGTDLYRQPTSGRWMPKPILGITGDGHPVYPAIREFEMRFNLSSQWEKDQLETYFRTVSVTGSVIVDLPQWLGSGYVFKSYTGCTVYEPEVNTYFTEHITDMVFMIGNIRT